MCQISIFNDLSPKKSLYCYRGKVCQTANICHTDGFMLCGHIYIKQIVTAQDAPQKAEGMLIILCHGMKYLSYTQAVAYSTSQNSLRYTAPEDKHTHTHICHRALDTSCKFNELSGCPSLQGGRKSSASSSPRCLLWRPTLVTQHHT